LFDLKDNKLIKSLLFNISRREASEIKNLQDIKFCASTSIEHYKDERKSNKNKISFFQNYQVCIFFRDLMRFKIWEFEASWSRSGGIKAP